MADPDDISILRTVLGPFVTAANFAAGAIKPIAPGMAKTITEGAAAAEAAMATAETMRMWIIKDFEKLQGTAVGDGECPAICQHHGHVPHTSLWIEGPKVKGNTAIPYGTAIATFRDGKYPNKKKGNHVAIYIEQDAAKGILVFDQWGGRPANYRWIRFKGSGSPSDDGDAFSVILTRKVIASPKTGK